MPPPPPSCLTDGTLDALDSTTELPCSAHLDDGMHLQYGLDAARLHATLRCDHCKHWLSLGFAPDPDLLIRTGGESRVSNFLLWQLAYSELYFTETLWPAFGEAEFARALDWFRQRERRFGAVRCEDARAAGVPRGA